MPDAADGLSVSHPLPLCGLQASAAALKAAERDARRNRGLPRLPLDPGWQAMEVDDLPLPPPPFPVQQPSPGKRGGGEGPACADTHTTSAAIGTHHAHEAGERRHSSNRRGQDAAPQGNEQTTSPAPRPSKVSKTNLVPVTGSRLGSSNEAPQPSESPSPAARAEPQATAASLAPSTGSVDVQRAVRAAVEAAAAAHAAAVAARAAAEPGQQEAVDGMQAEQLQMLENYAKDVAIQAAGLQVSALTEPCGTCAHGRQPCLWGCHPAVQAQGHKGVPDICRVVHVVGFPSAEACSAAEPADLAGRSALG